MATATLERKSDVNYAAKNSSCIALNITQQLQPEEKPAKFLFGLYALATIVAGLLAHLT